MKKGKAFCPWCELSWVQDDICGVYCTAGFDNADGNCKHYSEYIEEDERMGDAMAFKTNVVKVPWRVTTREFKGYHEKDYIIMAESEETAKMQVPAEEEVLLVERIGGGDGK